MLSLLWLLAGLAQPSWADDLRTITIYTEPPGATITDQHDDYLGKSGQEFQLNLTKYGGTLDIKLKLEGFTTEQERIPTLTLKENRRYPVDQKIELDPDGLFSALKYHGSKHWIALFLICGVSGSGMMYFWSRQKIVKKDLARGRRLEELKASSNSQDSLVLAVLGEYRIIDELGKGGMATVYRALKDQDLDYKDVVAVKVLRQDMAENEEHLGRFRREINVYRNLSHPNIVKLIDWGLNEARIYLVLEYIAGETLEDRLESGKDLDLEEAVRILSEIAAAVSYAHDQGVVHRDLKPANIMLDQNGRVKVMDFGLAKSVDAGKFTQTGTVVGTPAYMAPEQIASGELNPGIDQYALGCIAYELFTGRTPFVASDPIQLIFQHISDEAPAPSTLRHDLPPEADEVILKMLAKAQSDRFLSVELAIGHLERTLL